MESLLWFIASLVLLVAVTGWIHQHTHGIAYLLTGNPDAALVLYALILLPGVLLHELSHAVMAFILRVRTSGLTVWPRRDQHGHIALGSVMVEKVDVARASLIGLAPLLFGCGAVLLIGHQVFGVSDLGTVIVAGEGPAIAAALRRLFEKPDALLWLYLIFAVSNAMLPSASDREMWPPIILFIVGVAILALVADQGELVTAMSVPLNAGLTWLTAALGITLAVDLPVLVLILLLERGAESISGKRIYYYKPGDDEPRRRR